MRIVIDAMCAEYGGIRTYVEHLLSSWAGVHPHDEVHVALRRGSTLATPGLSRHEWSVPPPEVLWRPLRQTIDMHRMIQAVSPDAVLATAPTTDVRRVEAPLVVAVLDLRAELRPHQFSRGRRLLRRVSYGRTYRLADGFVAISDRTLGDLHRLHPETRSRPGVVTHLGADHVHDWPQPRRDGPAVAMAHHTNKNPRLVLDAWRLLRERGEQPPGLTLLGVTGERRADLAALVGRSGLTDHVTLTSYLPDGEFRRTFAEAAMVVFPSDFEGFGLPVVEGMALGKPVVIGPDPGTLEVGGGHAFVARDWSTRALADAVAEAAAADPGRLADAARWADTFTWERTVRTTRAALAAVAAPDTADPHEVPR